MPIMSTLKFPGLLWKIVNNCNSNAISWTPNGIAISINQNEFVRELLKSQNKPFKTGNFKSFIRQLNLYGFRKLAPLNFVGNTDVNSEFHEYHHPSFHRDHPELLSQVQRNCGRGKKSYSSDPLLISHPLLNPVCLMSNNDFVSSTMACMGISTDSTYQVGTGQTADSLLRATVPPMAGILKSDGVQEEMVWLQTESMLSQNPVYSQEKYIDNSGDQPYLVNPTVEKPNIWDITVTWPKENDSMPLSVPISIEMGGEDGQLNQMKTNSCDKPHSAETISNPVSLHSNQWAEVRAKVENTNNPVSISDSLILGAESVNMTQHISAKDMNKPVQVIALSHSSVKHPAIQTSHSPVQLPDMVGTARADAVKSLPSNNQYRPDIQSETDDVTGDYPILLTVSRQRGSPNYSASFIPVDFISVTNT